MARDRVVEMQKELASVRDEVVELKRAVAALEARLNRLEVKEELLESPEAAGDDRVRYR